MTVTIMALFIKEQKGWVIINVIFGVSVCLPTYMYVRYFRPLACGQWVISFGAGMAPNDLLLR